MDRRQRRDRERHDPERRLHADPDGTRADRDLLPSRDCRRGELRPAVPDRRGSARGARARRLAADPPAAGEPSRAQHPDLLRLLRVLRELYPAAPLVAEGWIDVGAGHARYWKRLGTRGGIPVVILHGGPGGGMTAEEPRMFDPSRYDVLTFDQRGCGKSRPFASLDDNTTWDLVADFEQLRVMLGHERWQVFGGSWGSSLALANAETHPERVTGLSLRGVCMLRKLELDWYYQHGASMLFPDKWEPYLVPIPPAERHDLMAAYRRRLTSSARAVQLETARARALWEGEPGPLLPQ